MAKDKSHKNYNKPINNLMYYKEFIPNVMVCSLSELDKLFPEPFFAEMRKKYQRLFPKTLWLHRHKEPPIKITIDAGLVFPKIDELYTVRFTP